MKFMFTSKQNSPKWDAAFCGVTSGAILFAYVQAHARYVGYLYMHNFQPAVSELHLRFNTYFRLIRIFWHT